MTRVFTLLAAAALSSAAALAQPVQLHPDNPHYFLYRGQPTVLVTSGEHYGSVLNPDLNYVRYLDTLQRDGLNQTRLFLGTYFEKPGDFGIRDNTLGPTAARVLTPWARSPQAGSVWGGAKYDLERWDETFFTRLRDFMAQADRRGIVVELTFFSDYYGTKQSPLFAENNVNGVGAVASEAMNTEANGGALAHQERLVRRVVRDLNGFDNLIYEIQNEPWVAGGVTTRILQTSLTEDQFKDPINMWKNRVSIASPASLAWQRRVSGWVADEETRLAKKHLVSQNVANFVHPVGDPDPRVSVLGFHYAWPDAVRLNYGLNRVISLNETGFAGREDATYRRQAWRFLLAGGGAFNHLDYSFTVGHEDGTAVNDAPGGGSVALRRQFGVLRTFLQAAPLPALRPDYTTLVHAGDAYVQALATADRRTVLLYVEGRGAVKLDLDLPAGRYLVEWTDPVSGRATSAPALTHAGGRVALTTPAMAEDLALRLQRQ